MKAIFPSWSTTQKPKSELHAGIYPSISQITLPISGLHYWYSFVTYRMHPEASSSVSSSHIAKSISCIAITRLYRNFQIFQFNFVHVTLSCIGICTVYNNDWTILFKLQYLIITRESIYALVCITKWTWISTQVRNLLNKSQRALCEQINRWRQKT